MPVTLRDARVQDDYTVDIFISNGNRLTIHFLPLLKPLSFFPLMEDNIWKDIEVREDCLSWGSGQKVEIPIEQLLDLFRKGSDYCTDAAISKAEYNDWILHLQLDNGNSLTMDMEPLLEYSVFAPLVQTKLWNTLQAREHSLLWEDTTIRLELPLQTILNYFM